MKLAHPSNTAYQVGGCLPEDAPSYVVRKADDILYKSLLSGEFCYVLNSRQMGKSSLRVRTMKKLQEDDIACAAIDLTAIGTHKVTPEKWYGALIKIILNHFELREKIDFRAWLKERNEVTPVQCFCEFIEEILLVEVPQKIVVFIDEIDSVLRLEFKDDFFALIRACYNKRAEKPAYKRLSFVLLGVATPSDLINDKTRTPFNIGRAIELRGFQLDEVKPLIRGMEKRAENAQEVIEEILYWTGGQPFLTQKVCQLVYSYEKTIPAGSENLYITKLVRKHIIENWETKDEPEHLRTICNRILRNEKLAGRLLGLYQRILLDGQIKNDDSYEQVILLLSGLVVKNGNLKPYNLIYKNIFDLNWVENALINLQPYSEAINAWLSSNCLDESRLLRGKALQEALKWAKDKSLSTQDYQFLSASQSLEKLELKVALETADKCNDILAQAQQKARRTIRRGLAGLAVISVATVLVTLWGNAIFQDAQKKLELAKKDTQAAKQELEYTRKKAENLNLLLHNKNRNLDEIKRRRQELEIINQEITAEAESSKKRFLIKTKKLQKILYKTKAESEKKSQEKNLIKIKLDKLNQEIFNKEEEVKRVNAKFRENQKRLKEIIDAIEGTGPIKKLLNIEKKNTAINNSNIQEIYLVFEDNQNIIKLSTERIVFDDINTVNQPYKYEVNLLNKNNNSDINKSHISTDEVKRYEVTDNCTSIDKVQLGNREELLAKLQKRLKGQNFDNDFITGDFGRTTKLIKKLRESKKLNAKGVNCFHSFEVSGLDIFEVSGKENLNANITIDSGSISSAVSSNYAGNGGDINITADSLSLAVDTPLSMANNGQVNTGDITINATDSVELISSGITDSKLISNVTGNAGDIQITTSLLSVTNGAQLSAANNNQGNFSIFTIPFFSKTPAIESEAPKIIAIKDSIIVPTGEEQLVENNNYFLTVPTSPIFIPENESLIEPPLFIPENESLIEPPNNPENESVIELQKFLKDKGFYKGSINGVWNTQTQKALDAFKRYYNID